VDSGSFSGSNGDHRRWRYSAERANSTMLAQLAMGVVGTQPELRRPAVRLLGYRHSPNGASAARPAAVPNYCWMAPDNS
jgi:hypothetical protein